MISILQQCSIQYINQVFESLDEFTNHVFWIRSSDMIKQFYISPNFTQIWQLDVNIIIEIPSLWNHYLHREDIYSLVKKFHNRSEAHYLNDEKNSILYQVMTPKNQLRYLFDRCIRCHNKFGDDYIVGFSKNMNAAKWHSKNINLSCEMDTDDNLAMQRFLDILLQEFGIAPFDAQQAKLFLLDQRKHSQDYLQSINFTQRELECLYQICKGQTNKETAKLLSISPRTVETYIERIFNKTSCNSKIEVISRFAHHFHGKF